MNVTIPQPAPQPARVPAIFRILSAAIAHAARERDDCTVDLLLVGKMAMIRHYHGVPWEAR